MTMLAETVDAVIGIGTHRDTHEAEIADAAGLPLTVLQISNDSAGFARLLARVAEVAPGPRIVACIEGGRSYGIGLARALTASGLLVIECEQPSRKQRRGQGKSDPIDAHLAVLAALRLDAARLPALRADGDREALRILLVARQEIKVAATARASRLRALLLTGDDADRRAARRSLSKTALTALTGRELPADAAREQLSAGPRSAAWRSRSPRPASSSSTTRPSCWPSSKTSPPGSSAGSGQGRSAPRRPSSVSPTPAAAAAKPPSPPSAAPARSRPAAAEPSGTGSTAAATAPSTAPSTPSPSAGSAAVPAPAPTSPGAPPKARPPGKSVAA